VVVALAILTLLGVDCALGRLTPLDKEIKVSQEVKERYRDPFVEGWSNWGSPVGLGLFFVLIAVAVDLVRIAFK
jgi:hypothetical protein